MTCFFVAAYLAVGFVIGYFAVRDGRCEAPASTWLFVTLAGPAFAAAAAVILIPILPFAVLVSILGIETSHSDTHGV